ncbi:unnamed protein product [Mesocestoides corti]|nr:unnamed protein product [Mesocestoides corti]
MYLPAKKYNMGNGILFQWIICVAMAFFSFAIHLCVGSPKIWPLTVLAGCSWATGNVAVVAIVKRLGMGVGMLIWSSINLLVGWASCRFGWFGLKPEVPKNNTLNIVGVTLAVMSVFFYAFIKPPPTAEREVSLGDASAVDETTGEAPSSVEEMEESPHGSTADSVPLLQPGFAVTVRRFWKSTLAQRLIGILLAALSGLFYGVAFAPIIYVQENYHDASHRGIDYLFPIGAGAFLASTIYCLIYCLVTLRSPAMQAPVSILPGVLSGMLCIVGQAFWLVANEALQASITFPIAATLPGAIATLIGTIFYREVRGLRNYLKLAVALCFTLAGSVLTGLSK